MEMADYKKEMGRRIKDRRKECKITQEEMSETLGISVKHFSEVERGLAGLSIENLVKLSSVLELSLDYLVKGEATDCSWEPLLYNLRSVPAEKQRDLLNLIHAGICLAEADKKQKYKQK